MNQPTTPRPPTKTQRLVAELSTLHPEAAAHMMHMHNQMIGLTHHLKGSRRSLQKLIDAITTMMLETNPGTVSAMVNTISEIQTPGYHKKNP